MKKKNDEHIDDVSFEDNDDKNTNKEQDTEVDSTIEEKEESKKSKKNKAEKKIEELEEKNKELNDKYLRLYSEFDNYRKRTQKERLDLLKNASQDMIEDLLPVLDDFDRALQIMLADNETKESSKGIELIFNKLFNLLSQKGLEPMDAMGKDFDTDFHEAITNIPAPKPEDKGKVLDVVQKGYLLNGKIIRFAKVVVGS